MAGFLRDWFFPEHRRFLPGARAWSIAFRTLHLAAFGILKGGHTFAVDAEKLLPSLWLTILSGIELIALEVYAVGLYWVFLGKGITVLVKLGILLAVPFFLGGPNIATPAGRGDRLGRLPYASPVSSLLLPPWAGDRARRTSLA